MPKHPLLAWLDPLIKLRHSLPEGATLDDLMRENVRAGVRNVVQSSVSYQRWTGLTEDDQGGVGSRQEGVCPRMGLRSRYGPPLGSWYDAGSSVELEDR